MESYRQRQSSVLEIYALSLFLKEHALFLRETFYFNMNVVSTQILWRVSKDYCQWFGVLRRTLCKCAGMYVSSPGDGFTKPMSSPSAPHWGVHRQPDHLTMTCMNYYFHALTCFLFRSLNMASATMWKLGTSPLFKVIKCTFTEQIFTEHLLHAGSVFQSTQCGTLWHLSQKGHVFVWPLIADSCLWLTQNCL